MTDEIWPGNADHPPLSLLLLHIEGELEGENARRVVGHVTHCWECRTRCEHLRQGIFQYMEFHATEPLPPPPTDRSNFSRRLLQAANERSEPQSLPPFFTRVMAVFTPRTRVFASAAALAVIAAVFLTMSSRNIAAGEILDHAVIASKTLNVAVAGRRVYQKVRIRRGNVSFERTLSHDATVTDTAKDLEDALSPEAQRFMAEARINWADPLNAGDFSAWRNAQRSRTDDVQRAAEQVTIETTSGDGGAVREASLTVERSDWRPVRKHVEFRNGEPLDITEISFEIRNERQAAAPLVSRLNSSPVPGSPARPETIPVSGPSQAQLEEAELRLREAFHSIGVDVRDSPVIWTENGHVRFRIYPESPQRGAEVLHAIQTIPLVEEAPREEVPSDGALRAEPVQQLTTPFTTIPPLLDELTTSLGGLDNVNNYLTSLREAYARLLSESTALQRLGQRYPSEFLAGLSPDADGRIAAIAREQIDKIAGEGAQYQQKLLPVLRDMMRLEKLTPSTESSTAGKSCIPWQTAAQSVVRDAKELHSSVMELFIQRQVDAPTRLEAVRLLRDAERSGDAFRSDLQTVCAIQ